MHEELLVDKLHDYIQNYLYRHDKNCKVPKKLSKSIELSIELLNEIAYRVDKFDINDFSKKLKNQL